MFKLQIHLLVGCLNMLPNRFLKMASKYTLKHTAQSWQADTESSTSGLWPLLSTPQLLATSSLGASCHRLNPRFSTSLVSLTTIELLLTSGTNRSPSPTQ